MATILKVQDTINWAKPFLKNQPLDFATNGDPAMRTANMILQTMLAAPFKWRWNRGTYSFPLQPAVGATAALSDYLIALPDFGYLEDQVVTIGLGTAQKTYELEGKFTLARPTGQASRPTMIAVQFDDNAGNLTFRMNAIPDQAYTVTGEYQRKSPLLLSLASTIAPVPDEFGFIFNWGFLTVMSMLVNDPRAALWEKYFISRLLGVQDGLDQVDVDIFLGLWQTNTKTAQRTNGPVQAGQAGRGF